MAKVIIFGEHSNGKVKKGTLELLTYVKSNGHEATTVFVGEGAETACANLGGYNSNFLVSQGPNSDTYNPEVYAAILTDFSKKAGAKIILGSATATAKDLFPRVAARLDAGLASDCTGLEINGDSVSATKPLYAGKCFAKAEIKSEVAMVLMRANQLPVEEHSGDATIERHDYQPGDLKTTIKEVVKGVSEKLDLTEANIIVSGGRGLKEAENFKLLEELADTIGATVGASRAVVDAGWVGHNMQVGQTGKTVAPSLYIAVGISGAIQHLAGMNGSKVIVAINQDPEAPIFQKSTYGIVGDLFEVVPKLTEEFKKALQ